MILLCEHPAAAAGAKVENGFFVFQARSASFAPAGLDARAPNQLSGLSAVDGQGHPRAALDTNDLRIPRLRAQHPVESYGQASRRRHFGDAFRLAVTAVSVLFAKSFIQTNYTLRRFHQQHAQKTIALFGDGSQPLPSA